MFKRVSILMLAVLVALPVAGSATQRRRFGKVNRMQGLQPAQAWRLTTLTLEQRRQLRDLRGQAARVLTPEQLEAARAMPRGPLAPEELIYYPAVSLPDLDPARRAKIEAALRPAVEQARERARPEKGADRRRRMAYYEVLDALLTTEQMATVNSFLPGQLRKVGLKERVVFRLPSLTLEQEAEAKAVFAALEDETGADRARLKAINGELKGGEDGGGRLQLAAERREIQQRLSERERKAYADLGRVLGPEQMKELEGQRPGPPRPVVFTPEAIRQLSLTPEQRRRIATATVEFRRETRDERREVRELRGEVKGADAQSLEMAETRDKLRRAAEVLDDEREKVTRILVDTLTAEQIGQLLEISLKPKT